MDVLIEFSSEALCAFKTQIESCEPKARAIRLAVRGGSCEGLQYVVKFENDHARDCDIEWFVDDIQFVVDKKSLVYLQGSRITWKKSLLKQGFEFENPNEVSRCGCGKSFSV